MIAISAAEGYQLWADTWDSTASPIVALEERMLARWLRELKPRRAVDVGCGTGRWTARLGALGVDASPAMLAVAAGKPGLRGRVAVGDATALPFASASCDLAICALTLGHIRDRAAALAELSRILQPGGTLLLTDFHPAAAANGWRRTFRHNGDVYELEHHRYLLEDLLGHGLTLNRCQQANIGEPERALFLQAGRPELFDAATRVPAVLMSWWTRV